MPPLSIEKIDAMAEVYWKQNAEALALHDRDPLGDESVEAIRKNMEMNVALRNQVIHLESSLKSQVNALQSRLAEATAPKKKKDMAEQKKTSKKPRWPLSEFAIAKSDSKKEQQLVKERAKVGSSEERHRQDKKRRLMSNSPVADVKEFQPVFQPVFQCPQCQNLFHTRQAWQQHCRASTSGSTICC